MLSRRMELGLLSVWPLIAASLSLYWETAALPTLLLFLLVPVSALLLIRVQNWKNSLAFSLLISVPAIIIVDPIAEATGTWLTNSQFPTIAGLSLEALLWSVLTALVVTLSYERFWAEDSVVTVWDDRKRKISRYLWAFTAVYSAGVLVFLPSKFSFPYFYVFFGLVMLVLPHIIAYPGRERYYGGLIPLTVLFAFYFLVYEVVALILGNWSFPAWGTRFLGWVTVFGQSFPLEEFLLYIIGLAPTVVLYYDYWSRRL